MTDIRTDMTFEVAATPAAAWKALEELRARTTEPGEWWLPGFESRGAEVEVEPQQRLTVRKLEEPCADTLIAISFEHAGTGTRIRVVQSGFDAAFVEWAGESFWTHAEHIASDLHVFFETGVIAGRAWLPWAPLGVGVAAEPFGLRVTKVGRRHLGRPCRSPARRHPAHRRRRAALHHRRARRAPADRARRRRRHRHLGTRRSALRGDRDGVTSARPQGEAVPASARSLASSSRTSASGSSPSAMRPMYSNASLGESGCMNGPARTSRYSRDSSLPAR